MDFMSFSDSNEQSARSENGVWGLVPRLGVWGMKSPIVPLLRSHEEKQSGSRAKPDGRFTHYSVLFESLIKNTKKHALSIHGKNVFREIQEPDFLSRIRNIFPLFLHCLGDLLSLLGILQHIAQRGDFIAQAVALRPVLFRTGFCT